ncbi:hypothetical protein TNCT_178371 [Trichonephila clavata]|uniref:Uncharacterized protein n=1 Tax=Trichonephila clavata TaxID=2740835 RepID=A0A8X6KJ29_TRICU|nr:hypothetical protein TNCT_178371 [Trichonephila clavata]
MPTSLPSTDIPHSPTGVLEHFVTFFTSEAASFIIAVDVAAAKAFLSQSLYASFAIQDLFSFEHCFFGNKCHLPITHIPQISCKLMEFCFLSLLVVEKSIMKVHLEHSKVILEVSPNM